MNIINKILDNLKYLIILGIVWLITNFLTPINNSIVGLLDRLAPPDTVDITSSQTIINSITELGELVTVSYDSSNMDVFIEINKGRIEYYSAHHRVTGIIEAGIDFTAISQDSVIYDTEKEYYTLILPPTIITSCRILDIEQYGWSTTLLQAPWDKVRQIAQYESSLLFAEEMAGEGILKRAELETELRLGDFVSSLTGKPVVIVFKEREAEVDFHDFCDLELPSGWEKNEDGAWKQAG